ncbi:MAG TPA: hypothetical protein VIJ87_11535, partial [Pyrinomonadaceae bacterium]
RFVIFDLLTISIRALRPSRHVALGIPPAIVRSQTFGQVPCPFDSGPEIMKNAKKTKIVFTKLRGGVRKGAWVTEKVSGQCHRRQTVDRSSPTY